MRTLSLLIYSLFFLSTLLQPVRGSGPEKISLEDIYVKGIFTERLPDGLNSMKDGIHYALLNRDRIEKFSYRDGELKEVLFDGSAYPALEPLSGYELSPGEHKILLETKREQIYRHSYKAEFYVYDMDNQVLIPLSKNGKQQLASFSPDGNMVAFVRDNNLYIRYLNGDKEEQITSDGIRNEIINGAPDWVYEEEFAFSKGYSWSPDSRKIAYYRFDERRVREFSMTLFGSLYPESYSFKYPKAGEENALVSIRVYNLLSGKTEEMDTGSETDQYIPRIQWTKDPDILSMIRMNRLQNRMDILHAEAGTGTSRVVYCEENTSYISEPDDHTITYLPDGKRAIVRSEKEGYFHFYILSLESGTMQPITSGPFDIAAFMGVDTQRETLYYTSYEESSLEIQLYSIRLDGTGKKRLTSEPGTFVASFSNTFEYYILTHSSANTPSVVSVHNRKGKLIRVLEDNRDLKESMAKFRFSPVEFLAVPTREGVTLNAWMIKPPDFDSTRQYPLFMFVYGGPESQEVVNEWSRREPWFQMLAQHGYIVACVDNRGTNGRGEKFRKATYMQLGKLETRDQVEAARWFGGLGYVDQERIGIFGWSYGGFMTSLCMTRGNGTFKMGIAVAPVTSWRYYDTIYTERFMRTPQENPEGYDQNSPLHFADQLQGRFLLIHGMGDDNVHFQNSVDFTEALVQANKSFEMQFYPNKNHSISGGNTTLHLYTRMTEFILENL